MRTFWPVRTTLSSVSVRILTAGVAEVPTSVFTIGATNHLHNDVSSLRFLVAGHETSSTGTAWALYALTQAPHVQNKLRDELLTVETDTPTMDELNALPYLDMVVKEVLRLHAPVAGTVRSAVKDDEIPCGRPYKDRYGVERDTIR